MKEKPLIDFTDVSTVYDVPRLTHLDDEMREDEEGSLPVRVCSETDLTSPLKNDFVLTASGGGSVDDLEKSDTEKLDEGIIRGSRLRGPIISVTATQKDVKARQSQFEDMDLLEALIGERDRSRETEGVFDL